MANKRQATAHAWSAIIGMEITAQDVETLLSVAGAINMVENDAQSEGRFEEENFDLAKVADIYKREILAAAQEGRQSKPARLISEIYEISTRHAYNLIWWARQEGLIPPTERGRVGKPQDYLGEW